MRGTLERNHVHKSRMILSSKWSKINIRILDWSSTLAKGFCNPVHCEYYKQCRIPRINLDVNAKLDDAALSLVYVSKSDVI